MNFDSILNHKYNGSNRADKLSMEARAAQFAPFAALTGHDEAISETARSTISQLSLSADESNILSKKIEYALSFDECPPLSITYFLPDKCKSGGSYVTIKGSIKKIDPLLNILILTDNTQIPLNAIYDISSEIFN